MDYQSTVKTSDKRFNLIATTTAGKGKGQNTIEMPNDATRKISEIQGNKKVANNQTKTSRMKIGIVNSNFYRKELTPAEIHAKRNQEIIEKCTIWQENKINGIHP